MSLERCVGLDAIVFRLSNFSLRRIFRFANDDLVFIRGETGIEIPDGKCLSVDATRIIVIGCVVSGKKKEGNCDT